MYYGLFGKFTIVPGKRDELLDILVEAATLLEANESCIHYLVSKTDEPEAVWVYETWTDKAAHDVSLEPAEIRALIARAMPLIASMSDQTELQVVSGKGIST